VVNKYTLLFIIKMAQNQDKKWRKEIEDRKEETGKRK